MGMCPPQEIANPAENGSDVLLIAQALLREPLERVLLSRGQMERRQPLVAKARNGAEHTGVDDIGLRVLA